MSEDILTEADQPKGPPTERNPETTGVFRREGWWQITFPVVMASLLSILAIVLIALRGQTVASIVADYALALIIVLNAIGGLIILLLAIGAVYLVSLLIQRVPPYTYVAQKAVRNVYEAVDRLMNRIANVVILVRSAFAGLKHYLKQQGYRIPGVEPAGEESTPVAPQPEPEKAEQSA